MSRPPQRAAYPPNPVRTRAGASSGARRLPLVVRDVGFPWPRRAWGKPGREREGVLTWWVPVGHPAPAYAATLRVSSAPRWPYCAVALLASPAVRRRVGRGHIWKQTPPPDPINSLGNSLRGGFLTPLPFFPPWCLMIAGRRPGARPPLGSVADRSHVAARTRDWGLWAPRVAGRNEA